MKFPSAITIVRYKRKDTSPSSFERKQEARTIFRADALFRFCVPRHRVTGWKFVAMYLQFYINENGDKVYTTKKESPLGRVTESAHPGCFHSFFIILSVRHKHNNIQEALDKFRQPQCSSTSSRFCILLREPAALAPPTAMRCLPGSPSWTVVSLNERLSSATWTLEIVSLGHLDAQDRRPPHVSRLVSGFSVTTTIVAGTAASPANDGATTVLRRS
ncbi:H/ACA ribonucleoprotein complex subunit 3-like protein [Platanthera guangdongensis]|uniref:Nucleolar protein 10 n=1 Tax=Platanthera guangdongensis TaxID=2320717 RepID=A0ABR2MGA0_9ASPA